MNDSILDSIKKMLGIDRDYDIFDTDIIVGINAAFMTLYQLGVGPELGFSISGSNETWDDYVDSEEIEIDGVKQYVYLKTKLIFDPPTSSFVLTSIEQTIKELEWRLNVLVDEGNE